VKVTTKFFGEGITGQYADDQAMTTNIVSLAQIGSEISLGSSAKVIEIMQYTIEIPAGKWYEIIATTNGGLATLVSWQEMLL
jgi:hypothetical protein